ncbi:unnamed protein product [Rotaria socialis]|uniref:Beta-1,4-galactosyltransferase n=1 Tax=Rotaria socialis TaxID=392032 RepID=A0A820G6J5_9BILA|nr:unnamed protein product [Rotaria socialis]CAF3394477.1 unnamed protein product [Rotaria socialis]CAF3443156.1 unnamed protein product [Rotaria socialis]CAF3455511.1 unnamed protein product [Rotaria socialis]CAF3769063.1 unnamed protein product [Rotaria socialis]
MAIQRYRSCYRSRKITSSKRCTLWLSFILFVLVLLLIISYFQTSIYQSFQELDDSIIYKKPWYLLHKQKVLVPVSINRLYDYRVVCDGQSEILNQTELVNRLSTVCKINLNGSLNINLNPPNDFQLRSSLTSKYINLWRASNSCSIFENETLAIIISYRDREKNLKMLLYNLIPFLERQRIRNYKIFIIEQQASGSFNKGRLYNVAFNHLMRTSKPTCVIFHDVDLIPENGQNLYSCLSLTHHPLHMSANIHFDINGSYTTIYSFLVGGVLAMRPETFIRLNGYSNRYFNWGGEDDDMGLRFLSKDICVQRPTTGYYYAAFHSIQTRNPNRFKLLFDATLRQDSDGLNNIDQLASVKHQYEYPLVTWITVEWIEQDYSSVVPKKQT